MRCVLCFGCYGLAGGRFSTMWMPSRISIDFRYERYGYIDVGTVVDFQIHGTFMSLIYKELEHDRSGRLCRYLQSPLL